MEATTYVILDGPLADRSYTLNEDLRAGDRHTFPVLSDPSVYDNPAVWRLTGYVIKFDNEGRLLWNHYLPSSSLCSPRLSREDSALYAACRRASAR